MSLEQALKDNTEAVRALCNILQSGASLTATAETNSKDVKGVAAFAPAEGDPEGTRYWVLEKHNTVVRQLPGDPDPVAEGIKITNTADYLEKKAKYDALAKKAVAASNKKGAQTETPASGNSGTAGASTASSNEAKSGPAVKDVSDKLLALVKMTGQGPDSGKKAARALLDSYKQGAKLSEFLTPANAAEIMAKLDAAIAADGKKADADDDFV